MDLTTQRKDEFLKELLILGNSTRAASDKKYHKSQRIHWGVAAPQSNQLVKSISKQQTPEELILLSQALWKTNVFDAMLCSARILSLPKIPPSDAVWELLDTFLSDVDGWALEDTLAPLAWKCLLSNEELFEHVETWTIHDNFWRRRAALVYTLPYAKKGRNPERPLEWASRYATDNEWFIQKAIGWWLRVLGQHNPERVIKFLESHWSVLKGVARKESTRKLSSEWQSQIIHTSQPKRSL